VAAKPEWSFLDVGEAGASCFAEVGPILAQMVAFDIRRDQSALPCLLCVLSSKPAPRPQPGTLPSGDCRVASFQHVCHDVGICHFVGEKWILGVETKLKVELRIGAVEIFKPFGKPTGAKGAANCKLQFLLPFAHEVLHEVFQTLKGNRKLPAQLFAGRCQRDASPGLVINCWPIASEKRRIW
jgi:hypothetical protein